MKYSLSHLTDGVLLRDLAALLARDRATTAEVLAHLAEVDTRRLFLPAAHPSMFSYCVHELGLSEDSAYKRIQAARAARQFPVLFEAVAQGWLHLSGVCLLAPHLTAGNVDELLAAAAGKSKAKIEHLVAERFPRPEVPAQVQVVAGPVSLGELAPGQVETPPDLLSPERVPSAPERIDPRPKVTPLAPRRFALQCTLDQETHDKLRYAQELLSHEIPSNDIGNLLDRVLEIAIGQLEKRKFAACSKPRPRRASTSARHVPAHVKRAVWQRDGGRCTFVSETGHRCSERRRLEFDHIDPVARGGRATVSGIRLRCRAHNQYDAECAFGAEFMRHKRERALEARRTAVQARVRVATQERARAAAEEVIPWLRALNIRGDEARRAAERCETIPDAPLEERVRLALTCFGPRTPSRSGLAPAPAGP